MESDQFFLKKKRYLRRRGPFDVVLIDGLHTFRASLSDVLNVLAHLNKDGVIIMHDCFPDHKAAAFPSKQFPTLEEQKSIEGWDGKWCGDVWKTIVYLRRNLSGIMDICVMDTDHGLGILKPKTALDNTGLTIDETSFTEIDQLTYEDLIQDPASLLNLKGPDHAAHLIKEILSQR